MRSACFCQRANRHRPISSRFIYVGDRQEAIIGPDTWRIRASGQVVIPGLIDSHNHMLSGGELLLRLQLRD
ncbi:MAG: hypothetical protein ACYSWT_17340, partial [Planctomycetota bacterium]